MRTRAELRRRIARLRAVLVVSSVAVVLALLGALWLASSTLAFGGSGRPTVVVVRSGESVSQLASDLQTNRVIPSAFGFKVAASVFGAPTLHPGTYVIDENSTFTSIRLIFSAAPNARSIDITPGLTLREVAANQLAFVKGANFASQFLAAATSAARTNPFHPHGSLEGLVGLGIYVIVPHETPGQLVAAMEHRFVRQAAALGVTPSTTRHGLSAYQLIVGASIVEKEGYYRKNMGRVARVILNRLHRGGGLQMDSTVLYSFHQDGGPVTAAMLRVDTPYNTYLHAGLTPTPICQPSATAIRSMLAPPAGSWLYFVLVSHDGTMAFSATYAGQLANIALAHSRGL